MKVHEIMTQDVRCVRLENNLTETAGLMRDLNVGALPICENDRLKGMITDRDIVVRAIADGKSPDAATVEDTMSTGIIAIYDDEDVEHAVEVMEEKQVRRLPVVNRENLLVGIVSLGDLATRSHPAFSGEALKEISR